MKINLKTRSKRTMAQLITGLILTGLFTSQADAQTNKLPHSSGYVPNVSYTLKTEIGNSGMEFVGVGGNIDGHINPILHIQPNSLVQITLINGDGAIHDITVPQFHALSGTVSTKGASATIVFRANKEGQFNYYCNMPGHRAAGMNGKIIVGKEIPVPSLTGISDISRNPADLPPPVGRRGPKSVQIFLKAEELTGKLADKTTYHYWTFNGKVPGPMIRVRVGDTVVLHLSNPATSHMIHSIDLHAVIGPGGGAMLLQTPPGKEKTITFKLLHPGLFVYHCGTPMVAEHIANGMFGMILVEPAGGLPRVNEEFYVMQSEIYTAGPFGKRGNQEFSVHKLLKETPDYFVFNGSVGALTQDHPLQAKVGDTVRIFFGDAGPNFASSFHVIGEQFEKAWPWGSLANKPIRDVQTILVPPGGAFMGQFKLREPGKYILVDHALSRMEQGLSGFLLVSGSPNPALYHSGGEK